MCIQTPVRLCARSPLIPEVLKLIQRSFAYMETRINPPSSMHRLTGEKIREQCENGEVWVIGAPPKACVFLTQKERHLYLGKLAVEAPSRKQGLGRRLLELAEHRAREMGLEGLELETRIELSENHAAFRRLGFEKTAEGAHEGFARPTFIVMRKSLSPIPKRN